MQVAARKLYAAYRYWAERSGEDVLTETGFGLSLTERGFPREHKRTGIGVLQRSGCDHRRTNGHRGRGRQGKDGGCIGDGRNPGGCWGPWKLHRDGNIKLHLRVPHRRFDLYWIDLTTIYDRASMLDWVSTRSRRRLGRQGTYIQISLLQAFKELFGPQADQATGQGRRQHYGGEL